MNKIHLTILGILSLMLVCLTSCKDDDEPITLSMSVSMTWNGPELTNGETLEVSSLAITEVTVNEETVENPSVAMVQYFIGNKLIGESKSAPYRVEHLLEELPEGVHEFRVDVVFNDLPKLGKQRAWTTYQLKIKEPNNL